MLYYLDLVMQYHALFCSIVFWWLSSCLFQEFADLCFLGNALSATGCNTRPKHDGSAIRPNRRRDHLVRNLKLLICFKWLSLLDPFVNSSQICQCFYAFFCLINLLEYLSSQLLYLFIFSLRQSFLDFPVRIFLVLYSSTWPWPDRFNTKTKINYIELSFIFDILF